MSGPVLLDEVVDMERLGTSMYKKYKKFSEVEKALENGEKIEKINVLTRHKAKTYIQPPMRIVILRELIDKGPRSHGDLVDLIYGDDPDNSPLGVTRIISIAVCYLKKCLRPGWNIIKFPRMTAYATTGGYQLVRTEDIPICKYVGMKPYENEAKSFRYTDLARRRLLSDGLPITKKNLERTAELLSSDSEKSTRRRGGKDRED